MHMSSTSSIRKRHHDKSEVCLTRPSYRNGRHPKAVKVYTVGHESIYLLVRRLSSVPGSYEGLIDKMKTFGDVLDHKLLADYPKDASETFTDVALVKFKKLVSARIAKKRMDDLNYMGESLHCCYAPEFETVEECREKLETRRRAVLKKLNEEKLVGGSEVVVSSDSHVGSDDSRNSTNDDIKGVNASHGNHQLIDAPSEQLTSNSFIFHSHISQQPQYQQYHQLYQQQQHQHQQQQFQEQIQQQFQQQNPQHFQQQQQTFQEQIQHQQPHPQFDLVQFQSPPYQHHQDLHPQSFHHQQQHPQQHLQNHLHHHQTPQFQQPSYQQLMQQQHQTKRQQQQNFMSNQTSSKVASMQLYTTTTPTTTTKTQTTKTQTTKTSTTPTTNLLPRQVARPVINKNTAIRHHNQLLREQALMLREKQQGPTLLEEDERKRKMFHASITGDPSLDATVMSVRNVVNKLSSDAA